MRTLFRFVLLLLVVAVGAFLIFRGAGALQASVPRNMPSDAEFIASGFNLASNEQTGQWVSCKNNGASNGIFCRVTDAGGSVVYQGEFEPLDTLQPVSSGEMRLASHPGKLWVKGPAEGGPVPVIPLRNGRVLVPLQDREALIDRWKRDPTELREAVGE